MTRAGLANGGVLALALVLAAWGGLERRASRPSSARPHPEIAVTTVRRVALAGGGQGIADASGHVVPLRDYRRIVSTNLMSDRLLAELAEPDRIAAFSSSSARQSPWRWRFAGKTAVNGFGQLEPIIALHPDLVLVNVFGGDGRIARLLDAGVEVFDLGELHGLRTFLPTAEVIGELLGDPARGRQLARSFQARLRRVAAPLGNRPRRRAIYLWALAGKLFGATRDTSAGDVLTHAGLVDVAAAQQSGWPEYRAEQVVAMDPDLVVTQDIYADTVCSHPGLARLSACQTAGRVLTLPAGLIEEPGAAMLDAAELLFAKAYPDLAP